MSPADPHSPAGRARTHYRTTHLGVSVRTRKLIAGAVVVGLTAVGVALVIPGADAAVPAPTAGNVTVLSAAPRLAPSPGTALAAGETKSIAVAGKSFGGILIPASATGVTLSVTASKPQAAGTVTVWTTDAGKPGTATVTYAKGVAATAVAFVGLNDAGKLNINSSAATNVLVSIQAYVSPVGAPAAPVVKSIAAVARGAIDVGGSIRIRSTLLGKVTLQAGTWDARVATTFTGFNAVNNTVASDVRLTGTVVLAKGDAATWEFPALATTGGVEIPDAQSTTLTQDPTPSISTFITLTEETVVSVRVFAYASDSSQAGSGELKAGLDSATFVRLS